MQCLSQDCVGYEVFNSSVLQYQNDFRVRSHVAFTCTLFYTIIKEWVVPLSPD